MHNSENFNTFESNFEIVFFMVYVEDVFKDSGVPTYTFVEPNEYTKIIVSLRAKGRCLIIEGPSGIGKTTCLRKALEYLNMEKEITMLSARKRSDLSSIMDLLSNNVDAGIVVIDDFHLLDFDLKKELSNLMKTIADEDRSDIKLVLIGINRAGDTLIEVAPDLNNRITTVKFEINPPEKVQELIEQGEKALNIKILNKPGIVTKANGSFHIAQMLCKELCLCENVLCKCSEQKILETPINKVVKRIMADLTRGFEKKAKSFAVGTRARSEGRAPYFHLLHWLAESKDWSIRMDDIYIAHPNHKASISQVADKGFLSKLINNNDDISSVIHYDDTSKILTIEDPKFIFYLQNINWDEFAQKIGFINIDFINKYDFALSFSGEMRYLASALSECLSEKHDLSVCYDYTEQHSILAENLEEYFGPIYKSEADYVVVILDKKYPQKVWTTFESKQFKDRFGDKAIIPVICKGCEPDMFSNLSKIGYQLFDPNENLQKQVEQISNLLAQKISDKRLFSCVK